MATLSPQMLVTELHTHTIPSVYSRFAQLIGEKHWLQRVKQSKEAIKGNPYLQQYLMIENEIAFQLDHLSNLAKRYGGNIPSEATNNRKIYSAAGFAAQVLSFVEALPKKDGERFCRRVRGAFKNPDDMRGLRLEMTVATHFIRRGKHVSWPEISGGGTFDLLVDNVGSNGLEVECKSISNDKGRKVHRREILGFFSLLKPHLQSTITGLSSGVYAVLTLPTRLPANYKDRIQLAKKLGNTIFGGSSDTLADGSSIRIGAFDVSKINAETFENRDAVRTIVDDITGTNNREVVVVGTRAGGDLAIAIQSAQDDDLLGATFDTLSRAARAQLSGQRAGMVIAGFSGLDAGQLLSIAQQDQDQSKTPTALRVGVSRFLSSADRNHLVGAGFLSSGSLRPVEFGSVDSGGTAYYFPKEESAYWSNDFKGLFSWEADH